MKIYPYLSYRREINETDVNYTRILPKVWDSSDSLNGNSCSLFIFIRSTIPMISGDFLTRWNSITVRKGREKGQFLGMSYFWIDVLGLNYLTKEPPSFPTFQVNARLCVNFIAVPKYSFLDSFFLLLFCVQNLCCNDSFQSRMLTSLRKSSSAYSFSIACTEFLLFFYLNFFLVSVCTRGFAYLLCWPRGRGIGLVFTGRFSFHDCLQLFAIYFFNFNLFLEDFFFFTHDNYPHPHPRPTTHDI